MIATQYTHVVAKLCWAFCRLSIATLCPILQADLAAKYVDIFHKYGLDLEEVQKLYEKHKHAPPVVRNAPPVAGNIMWARQLLRRIELPMTRSVPAGFVQHICKRKRT